MQTVVAFDRKTYRSPVVEDGRRAPARGWSPAAGFSRTPAPARLAGQPPSRPVTMPNGDPPDLTLWGQE